MWKTAGHSQIKVTITTSFTPVTTQILPIDKEPLDFSASQRIISPSDQILSCAHPRRVNDMQGVLHLFKTYYGKVRILQEFPTLCSDTCPVRVSDIIGEKPRKNLRMGSFLTYYIFSPKPLQDNILRATVRDRGRVAVLMFHPSPILSSSQRYFR